MAWREQPSRREQRPGADDRARDRVLALGTPDGAAEHAADDPSHHPFVSFVSRHRTTTINPRRTLRVPARACVADRRAGQRRSEEHTSELQSLMRISYAVFCLKHKNRTSQTMT